MQTGPDPVWEWTCSESSVAPCYAQDVFHMRPDGVEGESQWLGLAPHLIDRASGARFFWLGRVPCQTVKVVGILVGVDTYESRIVYHCAYHPSSKFQSIADKQLPVDDGTAVIQGHHRPQLLSSWRVVHKPKAAADVGDSVVIIGRVSLRGSAWKIVIDTITPVISANDEPRHWISVRSLHRTHYGLSEPFVLPSRRTWGRTKHDDSLDRPATGSLPQLSLHRRDLTPQQFYESLRLYMATAAASLAESFSPPYFTVSSLGAVPDLETVARRVVLAEETRLASALSVPRTNGPLYRAELKARMTRLLRWALQELFFGCHITTPPERGCRKPQYLDDPDPGEQPFIAVTAEFLGAHVMDAIGLLVARDTRELQSASVLPPAPAPGPTVEQIVSHLQNADPMWVYLSGCRVKECLDALEASGEVWLAAGERWELAV
ncbi:hypothetical protein C8R43DRAFT_1118490 [Mycena crocata]|nr:hypothetical protein C8R43DRAFT_1118490 [Mycena crocata]